MAESPWRPGWWMPVIICLVFVFIAGWFLPREIGVPLIIASVVCGAILGWMDQRAKAEHFRAEFLKKHEGPE